MMRPLRFVVIGLGGYGLVHIDAVRWLAGEGSARLTGVVALEVDRETHPDMVRTLESEDVALYDNIEHFMSAGIGNCDILTVPIGIHLHVPVSVAAMKAGLDVYCEKPAAGTVQEVDALIEAQQQTGRLVAIGFQHIYSHSIQELKKRVSDGRLGGVKRLTLMCGWPRSKQYYSRNEWAGRLRRDNHWILDSPANNANAHYVMNALYLCSEDARRAATPDRVRAELYRANKIESPDTVQLQFSAPGGVEGHIILSHAGGREQTPQMHIVCEKGRAYWQSDEGRTLVRYDNGTTEEFSNTVDERWRYNGFKDLIAAVQEERAPLCTPDVARPQTVAINAMHESCPRVAEVPSEFVSEAEDWEMFPPETRGVFRKIQNMDEYMRVAIAEGEMFSALGVPWAKPVESILFAVGDYRSFPSKPSRFE
jgi:predicted dehydrogenase